MAGFPHHALDTYLPRLIRAGHRVAICDQLEDPKLTKKLVKRGITELVTPGIALTDNVLNCKENNFLAAVHFGRGACGVAFLDISTGEFLVGEGTAEYVDKLLSNFAPKEVLYEYGHRRQLEEHFGTKYFTFELEDWAFSDIGARERLLKHFEVKNLKGFGIDHLEAAVVAAGAVLAYLDITQHTQTRHITSVRRIEEERFVRLDKFTVRNLELVAPMNEGGASLMGVIDHTLTPMGARLLHRWLLFPLRDLKAVRARQDVVDYFFRAPDFRALVSGQLSAIGDLERIVSKVAVGRVTPREMQQLRLALEAIGPLKTACWQATDDTLGRMGRKLDPCGLLRDRIARELQPDPPALLAKGGYIAAGVNAELDELRSLSTSSKEYLLHMQQREAEATGISSLKIGYNNVFGYYIEVTKTHVNKVPDTWIRKQTLVNAERYITPELKEYEEKILGAEDRIQELESDIYNTLLAAAASYIKPIQLDARVISYIDTLISFANIAITNDYHRPEINESFVIDIKGGRHPVIERQLPPGENYIDNDLYLDNDKQQIIIITGPNMAGKSALLRQTALIVIMAQAGCFVPAISAKIGYVDKVFTRVGASDNISLGESTFMVEMNEAANILNNISDRSLVLFDELGRGTSTYDGISIAWAIVEFLHENPKSRAKTLFATHYHELNEMERSYTKIKNFNVSVKEVNNKVVFLRKLVKGGSNHSFGIQVGKMAGLPQSVIKRSSEILKQLENDRNSSGAIQKNVAKIGNEREGIQLSFFQLEDPVLLQIRDEIAGLDINSLTPLEALNKLNEIKKITGI